VQRILAASLPLFLASSLSAQLTPGPTPSAANERAAASSASRANREGEQAVQLSTFTVREDQDIGYESMHTTAGMRTVQELKNVSNSISIMNAQLIEDTASLSMEEMSRWFVSGEDNPEPVALVASRVVLRGVPNAYAMRNGWIWYSPMDAYSTEKVELLRGPNAFLYGEADVGGAQNQITKRGLFTRDVTRLKLMAGSDDFRRAELDVNRRLVRNKLAVRLAAVQHNNGSWADEIRRDFRGIYGAATYRPFRNTQISVMAEHAKNTAVLSQGLWNDAYSRPGTGTIAASAGYVYVPAAGLMYRAAGTGRVNSTGTGVTIVDPTIVPKELHTNGPNATYKNYYDSVTLEAEQRIGQHLLLQVTGNFYQQQIDSWGVGAGRNVFRDLNRTLPNGQPNPYFGELYTEYFRTRNINGNTVRDIRFSAAYDLITKWTRQTFLLNVQQHQDTPGQKKPKWGEYVDPGSAAWAGAQPSQALTQAAYTANRTLFTNNRFMRRYYFQRDGAQGRDDLGPVPGVSAWFPDLSNTVPAAGQIIQRRFYTPSFGVGASGSWFKEHLFTHVGYRQDKFNMKTTVGAVRPLANTWVVDEIPGAFAPNPAFVNVKVDGSNAGAILRFNEAFAIGYNWAQSFRISAGEGNLTHRVGERQGVGVGEGEDISARLSLFQNRVELSAVRYHNFRPNDRFNPNPDIRVEDELSAIFPDTFLPTGQDYQTTTTEGYEFELMANLTRNWRTTLNFATNKVVTENRAPVLKAFQADARALGQPTPFLDAFLQTIPDGVPTAGYTKERANFFTRYTFTEGVLKGAYIGGGLNYRLRTYRGAADLDGIAATPPTNLWSPAYTLYSLLAGYQTTIVKRRTTFAVNISNLFDKEYYRSTSTTSGSWGDPRSYRFTITTDL
jgi:outer membrane receptor protein involved in Fe transport